MLKIIATIMLLLTVVLTSIFVVSQNQKADKYEFVSIYDLLTNFEEFDGKKIYVIGYLVRGTGFMHLFPTKEDYRIRDISRAIDVHPIQNYLQQDITQCAGHYVKIKGFFRRHNDFRTSHVLTLVEQVSILDENNKYTGYSVCAK